MEGGIREGVSRIVVITIRVENRFVRGPPGDWCNNDWRRPISSYSS